MRQWSVVVMKMTMMTITIVIMIVMMTMMTATLSQSKYISKTLKIQHNSNKQIQNCDNNSYLENVNLTIFVLACMNSHSK